MKKLANKICTLLSILLLAGCATGSGFDTKQVYINHDAGLKLKLDLTLPPPLDLTNHQQLKIKVVKTQDGDVVEMSTDTFIDQIKLIQLLSGRIYILNDYLMQYKEYYEDTPNK